MPHDPGFGLGTTEVKRRHILPKAIVVGVVAGLLASAFRLTLQWLEHGRLTLLSGLPPAERVAVRWRLGSSAGRTACGSCVGFHRTQQGAVSRN